MHTYLGTFIGVLMVLTLQRVKIGPWGGTGGHAWDEGGHGASAGGYTGVRRMSIGSSWCVSSMLFEYDDNGKRVKGTPQGERDNGIPEVCSKQYLIDLFLGSDFPSENNFSTPYRIYSILLETYIYYCHVYPKSKYFLLTIENRL